MIPPFANTGWPKYRVVTTAERVAIQANQAQINNLPIGFIFEEVQAGVFVALWARDDQAVGTLRQLQMIPQANSVTIASLGDDLVYVEEYEIPAGAAGPTGLPLGNGQRNSRLVAATLAVSSVGPAALGTHTIDILNGGSVVLARFEVDQNEPLNTALSAAFLDATIPITSPQVFAGDPFSILLSEGDIGFRLVLTWKVVA